MNFPQIIVYGRGDKVPEHYIKINTTSRSSESWARKFSPFLLGPIEIKPLNETIKSQVFENAWQYSKRYDIQDLEEWKKWSSLGFANNNAVRFPMGRGAKPMYAYYHGETLDYIESRFKIYAPLYEKCIKEHASESLNKLKKLIDEGNYIALFDYDGYYHYGKDMSLDDVIYNPKRKMGHSFVLLGMLTNNYFWKKNFDKKKINPVSIPRLR